MSVPTVDQVCDGEAGFGCNAICFPFVLTWHALRIYIFSCFEVLFKRLYRATFKTCVDCCCGPWIFTDKDFEGAKGLGDDKTQADWVRAIDLLAGKKDKDGKPIKPKLYEDDIDPGDLAQGAVGDCWLVAALACAAEHPGAIRKAFLTSEYNSRGRYRVRLFDGQAKAWVVITIDDRIPCKKGTKEPLYMKMKGNELWAVLLEKAFAKFCGSYNALDGGWAMWGWRALTGDYCFRLKLEGKAWKRTDFEMKRSKTEIDGAFYGTQEQYSSEDIWKLILNYMEDDSLTAASGGKDMGTNSNSNKNAGGLNGEQLNDAEGLVGTHAYSILDARELGLIPGLNMGAGLLGQTRLIKLRNPWGRYEWKGEWSDGAKEWDENPMIKLRLQPKNEDDGCFWMPWDKFYEAGFKQIDICDRSTKDDLKLQVNEDMGPFGIIVGALSGCGKFWCLCQGVRQIYFGKRSSKRTKTTKRGCERCMEPANVSEPVQIKVQG